MSKTDPRVDAYIAKSGDFAKPILTHLRALVHRGCPGAEETIKWQMPHFMHHGMLCALGAFKAHCSLHFWRGEEILGRGKLPDAGGETAMGQFGRIARLADLPPDAELLGYIQKAAARNVAGPKPAARGKTAVKKELKAPPYFLAALRQNPKALANFNASSYSHKKEYVEWIAEAKREETRQKRLATAVEWLAQGKSRNWKYQGC